MSETVSIILLNWNQPDLTAACLLSLRAVRAPKLDIIVVDNGSEDGSVERLRRDFPEARIIEAGTNLGFTGGNNLGMEHAVGDWVLLLNNDTEVHPDFLVHALEVGADPSIGAIGLKLRFFDRPDTLQYAGANPTRLGKGAGSWRGWGEVDEGQYDEVVDTPAAHGAAFMVRRSVVEQVGMLENELFIFYEELDWSRRILAGGWRIVFAPRALVWHKESMTTGKVSPFRTYWMTRNRILFVRRWGSRRDRATFAAWLGLASGPRELLRHVRTGRRDLAKALLTGVRDGLAHPGLSAVA